jgi:hypothetical protein
MRAEARAVAETLLLMLRSAHALGVRASRSMRR